MTEHFDFIVLGGGSAGFAAARTARTARQRVAIIDSAEELGGLCILRGCMPSKTVIYSAEVLHLAQNAPLFGLTIPEAKVDMPALLERKRRMVGEFQEYRAGQLESDRFSLFRERASFLDGQTIRLANSGRTLTADHFVIATGSHPQFPAIPGLREAKPWTSDDILELDALPASLIVLGGGVVACELAQYLLRLGVRVTQIQRSPHILKECSLKASQTIEGVFRKEGMDLYTGTRIHGIERDAATGEFVVSFEHGGERRTARGAHIFNALGREPNVGGLDLEAAGVRLTPGGQIQTDDYQQTTNPRIYAAGDVTGPYEIVHIAIMQGEVAASHALGLPTQPVNYGIRTSVVFTDPQVAEAGMDLAEAKEAGMDLAVAEFPFDDHGKSIVMEAKAGYVRAWADRASGKLVGAECVGKDGGELIHSMAVAVALGAKPADLLKVHWYHPTLSEIWSYPLEDLADELK